MRHASSPLRGALTHASRELVTPRFTEAPYSCPTGPHVPHDDCPPLCRLVLWQTELCTRYWIMDPVLTLAGIVAKWGAKQVTSALSDNDEVAALVADITGGLFTIVQQGDRAQSDLFEVRSELASIRNDVRLLVDQRYLVAQTSASRYLAQALLSDRRPADRQRDLESAERLLVEAAQSATTALDRALSERLLIMVRLTGGDTVGARHAADQLGLCIGGAADEMQSWEEDETRPIRLLAVLAEDLIGATALTDPPVETRQGVNRVGVGKNNRGLVIEVAPGSVEFAGFACALSGFTQAHLDGEDSAASSTATVSMDPRLEGPVEAWVGACQVDANGAHECVGSPFDARVFHVSPGPPTTLEGFHWFDAGKPVRQCVVVGGMSFSTAIDFADPD